MAVNPFSPRAVNLLGSFRAGHHGRDDGTAYGATADERRHRQRDERDAPPRTPATAARGMLISNQIRAARGLLRWSARILAEQAGVHLSTVQRMERSAGPVGGNVESVRRVQAALERAGVEFLADDDRPGVRLTRLAGAANTVRAARARRALSGKDKAK